MVRLDLAGKEQDLARLEESASSPDLWNDAEEAQKVLRQLAELRQEVGSWQDLSRRASDLLALADLAIEESEESLSQELERGAGDLQEEVERREFELLLNGPYDRRNAIVTIYAGAGGVDSQDWAEMLLRMYLRWAERRGFKTELMDRSEGEEAGIKSATVEITGPYAYGYLRAEKGVHRLVRLSPFDSAHRRHTSFASVEVMPEVEGTVEVQIPAEDIRMDVYRATGAGGQNVNKTSCAVRLTHIPTGIVATCQNERSQVQNRETAMKILTARLLEVERRKVEEERAKLRGEHVEAEWGNQIRSYVLHPYTMVKDHRTNIETSDVNAVLNGEIDEFINGYLSSQIGQAA
ncbi:MAG: peptide chain release factor 2 [Actinobacteria bacterium]|nr:peptide chain release factor 2 [Actinomycetota bacterium]